MKDDNKEYIRSVWKFLRKVLNKVEGKMGDYEAPAGWEEVEMNETNVTELQTRSTSHK